MTHLRILQSDSAIEQVSSAVIAKLYELATSGNLDLTSDLLGRLHTTATYQQYINAIRAEYPNVYITSDKIYFAFLDPEVLRLMSTTFGDGVGVTDLLLLSIASLGNMFLNNTDIVSFDELGSITGITNLKSYDFLLCTNLESIDLSNITTIETDGGLEENYCFLGCKNLFKNTGIAHLPNLTWISGKFFGWYDDATKNEYIKMVIAENCVYMRRSNYPFGGLVNLKAIIFPKIKNVYPNESGITISINGDWYHPNTFIGDSSSQNISVVELGAVAYITKNALRYSTTLRAVVLHEQNIIPTLQDYSSGDLFTSYFPNANCNIFVPDNFVATMLADSTWSNFSTHIKPISEYDFSDYIDDANLIAYYNSVFNNSQS